MTAPCSTYFSLWGCWPSLHHGSWHPCTSSLQNFWDFAYALVFARRTPRPACLPPCSFISTTQRSRWMGFDLCSPVRSMSHQRNLCFGWVSSDTLSRCWRCTKSTRRSYFADCSSFSPSFRFQRQRWWLRSEEVTSWHRSFAPCSSPWTRTEKIRSKQTLALRRRQASRRPRGAPKKKALKMLPCGAGWPKPQRTFSVWDAW
mmetsp:Transcript_8905/g.25462  ORF Transcript_8905/g.25462 Transcript_8905/m.25462 type:complete len:202 (-) Transcript_8905:460-1065(-)